MKDLKEFIDKGKALCRQIASAFFDTNNQKTAVEQFMESFETDSPLLKSANQHIEVKPQLYAAPDKDFYMESSTNDTKEESVKSDSCLGGNVKENSLRNMSADEEENCEIFCELAGLIEDLKRLDLQTNDDNVVTTIGFCESRIVEIMISCGCEPIDNELAFDNSRHVPSPFSFIQNGCEISKIVKPGLSYKNKVLVKAIVECKN